MTYQVLQQTHQFPPLVNPVKKNLPYLQSLSMSVTVLHAKLITPMKKFKPSKIGNVSGMRQVEIERNMILLRGKKGTLEKKIRRHFLYQKVARQSAATRYSPGFQHGSTQCASQGEQGSSGNLRADLQELLTRGD